MSMQRKYSIIALIAIFIPTTALANAVIPLIFVTLPIMLYALLPIIWIEAKILKNNLNLPLKKAMISSAIANTVSTIFGIPLTWFVVALLQFISGGFFIDPNTGLDTFSQKFLVVAWHMAWLSPIPPTHGNLALLAMLLILIAFFFVTWQIEYFIVKRMNKQLEPPLVKSVCLRANIITYGLLALVPISMYFV